MRLQSLTIRHVELLIPVIKRLKHVAFLDNTMASVLMLHVGRKPV